MRFLPIEEKILTKLSNDSLSEKDQIRLRYGFYLVSDAIKKGIFIYIPTILLGLFLEFLVMHCSFFIVRQVTFGWHGRTSFECIVFSIIAFFICPFLLTFLLIPLTDMVILSVLVFGVILFIGPKGTKINTLNGVEISKLRKKLLFRVFLLGGIFFIIPIHLQKYLLLGVIIQLIALLVQSFLNLKSKKKKLSKKEKWRITHNDKIIGVN